MDLNRLFLQADSLTEKDMYENKYTYWGVKKGSSKLQDSHFKNYVPV